jgi:iron(III) transport system substrate-binding protein
VSRLQGPLLAFATVLLSPFAVRLWLGSSHSAGGTAAPGVAAAGTSTVVRALSIITPHNQDIRRAFELAFTDWHQTHFGEGIALTFLTPGGTNDIVRFLEDAYGAYRQADGKLPPEDRINIGIDVVWGGGDYVFERNFKPFLEPLSLPEGLLAEVFPKPDLAGVALFDPAGLDGGAPRWVGVALSSFGIIYSPDVYASLGARPPETWTDLARPELAGLLALADPTRSGSAASTYMMVLQRAMASAELGFLSAHPELTTGPELEENPEYRAALGEGWKAGMRTLVLMAANARYFTDSASRPCADVGDGESAAGIAIDFYARVYEGEIGPQRLRFIAPRGATAITPDPVGVLYGTRDDHAETANRFVQFLLSREGQRLWNLDAGQSPYSPRSLRRLPVRRDVYADHAGFADSDNPFELAAGFNMRQRWMRQLGRLLPIWAAAWLDAKSSLDEAYRAVLAVPEPARREQLRFELSDIPIEYTDLAQPGAPAPPGVDARLVAARERARWGALFRGHYRAVRAHAEGKP